MANVGDRVLICDGYWENKILTNTFEPLYGTVEKKYQSEDRSHHGSPMYDTITVVRGEDGKRYTDDSEQSYSRDWKRTPKFFTEQEFSDAIQKAIRKKEREISSVNRDIDVLKRQSAVFGLLSVESSVDKRSLISAEDFAALQEIHWQKENVLKKDIAAAQKTLSDHQKSHPDFNRDVFVPLVNALCEKMKEEGLLSDPKSSFFENIFPSFTAFIHESNDPYASKRYELRLHFNINQEKGIELSLSKEIKTSNGVRTEFLYLDPKSFDLDQIVAFMPFKDLRRNSSLDDQIQSASTRAAGSQSFSHINDKAPEPEI